MIGENTKLSIELEKLDLCSMVSVETSNGMSLGSLHVGNYVEALQSLDIDFTVIYINDYGDYPQIVIKEEDENKIRDFKYEVDANALSHDLIFGDGKYWKKNDK